MSNSMIEIDDIKKLAVAYSSLEDSEILSMDFHLNGEYFVYNTSSKIKWLSLGDTIELKSITLEHKKYNTELCKFYDRSKVIHTSTVDYNLRLLDVTTTSYSFYFPGHSKRVVSVAVKPEVKPKYFASGSEDKTFCIWDPRRQHYTHRAIFSSTPFIAIHPEMDWIAVMFESSSSHIIEYYEMKNLDEHTHRFDFPLERGISWTGVKFSPDHSRLIVTTNTQCIIVIDAVGGREVINYRGL
jgi:WD40 repeat protein